MEVILRIYLAFAVIGFLTWFVLMRFLWQGGCYFAEMRQRAAEQRVCSNCHALITRPGARHCGHCGYKLLKAA